MTHEAPEAGRVHSRRWRGEDVDLETVLERLTRLHAELAHHDNDPQEPEHPHPRNCVINLVVAVRDEGAAELAERTVEALAASHPMRAILVCRMAGEGGERRLDADILTEIHRLVRGAAVQREQVVLRVPGPLVEHLSSLVEPLLVPDLATYLWWAGTPPLQQGDLRRALAACDVLIVDSAQFERPVLSFLELAALADRMADRKGFADLQWARQRPWRESLAQFFAPDDRRALLEGVTRLEVRCGEDGHAGRVAGGLLVGWVASALGWRLMRAAAISESAGDALMQSPGGEFVHVAVRGIPGWAPGELAGATLEGSGAGRRFAVSIELDRERGDHGHLRIDLAEVQTLHQRLSLPRQEVAALLVRMLAESRRDPVFVRSLASAATLVDALQ
jgi:glucose-6-phosphate dehydrogenase assembly protein OpcA